MSDARYEVHLTNGDTLEFADVHHLGVGGGGGWLSVVYEAEGQRRELWFPPTSVSYVLRVGDPPPF